MSDRMHKPPEAVRQPVTLRQSLLTAMDACPYSGYLAVAHGGTPNHLMHRGSAFHGTVARCVETMTLTGNTTIAPDDAKAIMLEVLDEHPEWVIPATVMDGLRVMVYRWALGFVLPHGARAETPFWMEVDGQTVTGTIDLLWVRDGTLFIRDYKAGWHLYPQSEVSGTDTDTREARGARAAQLITYALLCADGKSEVFELPAGINKFDLAFVFPMFNGDHGEGMAERGVVVTRPELIEHREWIRGLVGKAVRGFHENRFAAVPGSHCTRCPAAYECPLPAKSRGGDVDTRTARDVAEEYHFMKQGAEELRKALKAHAEEHGPIRFGRDLELSFRQTASGGRRFGVNKREAA